MRSVNTEFNIGTQDSALAQLAGEFAARGIDSYSDYGVGAVLVTNYYDEDLHGDADKGHYRHIYGGFNLNISGMQNKIHAEQLALFQAVLDIEFSGLQEESTLEKIIVATTEDDYSLVCGHCLQVVRSFCEHYDWEPSEVEYSATAYEGNEEMLENRHVADWEFRRNTLAELLQDTYIENRSD